MNEKISVKFIKDIFGPTVRFTMQNPSISISTARDLIAATTPHLLADACVNHRFFTGCTSDVFSTERIARDEAEGNLSHYLPSENTQLRSFTRSEFSREENSIITVTGFNGETATVKMSSISQQNNMTTCAGDCGHAEVITLTNMNTYQSVVLCNTLINEYEFDLAVWAIAFPNTYTIITNDKCLGYSFSAFNAFCPEKKTFWKNL